MSRIALTFGFSEQGVNLAKRVIISFYKHVLSNSSKQHTVDIYPYKCNFKITDLKEFTKNMKHQELPDNPQTYEYTSFSSPTWDFPKWPGNICEQDCSIESFQKVYLPDVAVYHDFATKYASNYDYVLYCHDDVTFTDSPTGTLDRWIEIVADDSPYSIIAELRTTANFDLSIRFHLCFVFTNTLKFTESSLSFVNDLTLMDGNKFHIYSNGGSGLLTSLYVKQAGKPQWKPYLIDVHGIFRGKGVTDEDKWFHHRGEIEWNRHQSLSEFSSNQNTKQGYKEADEYVNRWIHEKSDKKRISP